MSKDILYQPQIGYEKSYYTEGTFNDTTSTTDITQTSVPSTLAIDNLLDQIDKNLKWIPVSIKETYLSPYVALKEEYLNVLKNTPTTPESIEPTVVEDETGDDDFPSDPFDKGTDIYIDISDPQAKRADIAMDKYTTDFLDIYKDYLEKLNTSTQNYLYATLSVLNMTDENHNLESYSTTDINNENLSHISDYLAKSNISFKQTTMLHKKLFDMDSTILHIRGIKLAEKLIERYYSIERLDNENDLAVSSNVLLTESQRIADKKYKENFYALYKYLNSSVILMNESTQMLLKQNKSILTLNMYEERGN